MNLLIEIYAQVHNIEHPFCISAVVANSDESQLLTPGKMSQRQGKEAYFTPTKELLQPSLSPATTHSHGKTKLCFTEVLKNLNTDINYLFQVLVQKHCPPR